MTASDLQSKIADWLIDGARSATAPTEMMAETLRAPGRGRPAAVAGRRLRSHAASRYFRPQFHLAAGRRGRRGRRGRFRHPGFAGVQAQPAGDRVRRRAGRSGAGSTIPTAGAFRFSTTCAPKASPTTSRCRCCSSTASIHASSWTTKQPGGFSDEQLAALRSIVTPLTRMSRDHQPAAHRLDAARHLCRQPRRRAHSRRPDPARPHRHHACRDLAVGPARLHGAVGPAAGRDRGGHSQSLFRLPGVGDPERMAARC